MLRRYLKYVLKFVNWLIDDIVVDVSVFVILIKTSKKYKKIQYKTNKFLPLSSAAYWFSRWIVWILTRLEFEEKFRLTFTRITRGRHFQYRFQTPYILLTPQVSDTERRSLDAGIYNMKSSWPHDRTLLWKCWRGWAMRTNFNCCTFFK